jgi:predicted nucleic acid-binding protein
MNVFADTSALFALIVKDDALHEQAVKTFAALAEAHSRLITSSFVLAEISALLQHRVGRDALQDFYGVIYPLLDVVWVDEELFRRGMQRLLLDRKKGVSLTDSLSFEIMETRGFDLAFAFDRHFVKRGFARP